MVSKTDLIYPEEDGLYYPNRLGQHHPFDVRASSRGLLEERNKKRDEEDLLAALASINVDRRGKVARIKEIDFASTSTDASTEV